MLCVCFFIHLFATVSPESEPCNKPPKVTKALADIPDTFEEGAVATYSCATRYRLVGDSKLTCSGGRWTGVVPRCQGVFPDGINLISCVWPH